jgi:hypothetical protein
MRHYRNLIADAEIEVMIATNYWEPSYSSSLWVLITKKRRYIQCLYRVYDGLIELSKRHEGKPTKPVVKLIYDRGNPKQVIKNHQRVPPEDWQAVGLPKKEEIPNIEFEVMASPVVSHRDSWFVLRPPFPQKELPSTYNGHFPRKVYDRRSQGCLSQL